MRSRPKILILAGSIRSGSYFQRTADVFPAELVNHDCELTRITLKDYPLPIMDEDLESEKGIPASAQKLAKLFASHDALVIVTPEYNGSLPALLKNALDWISRVSTDMGRPIVPYKGKIAAIASSSPGAMGGISGLGHLRDILVRLGVLVLSEQIALGKAADAFNDKGQINNEFQAKAVKQICVSLVEKAAHFSKSH